MNFYKYFNSSRYSKFAATCIFLLLAFNNLMAAEDTIFIDMQEYEVLNGDDVYVDLKVSGFKNVVGAQFTLNYDKEVLNYLDVDNFGIASINKNTNFGIPEPENGTISFLWYDFILQGVNLEDESTLFRLKFKAVGGQGEFSYVELDTSTTISGVIEISNTDGEVIPVVANKGKVTIGPVSNTDFKISDFNIGSFNPSIVGSSTNLIIESPLNKEISYTMLDLSGKIVSNGTKDLVLGENIISFDQSDLPVYAGTYFVEFKIGNYKIARKFIKM